jgi:arginine deiminase
MVSKEATRLGANSEYGELEEVLVSAPGLAQEIVLPFEGVHPLFDPLPISVTEAGNNHAELKKHLQEAVGEKGVRFVGHLLADVLEQTEGLERIKFLRDALGEKTAERYISHLAAEGSDIQNYNSRYLLGDILHGYPFPEIVDGKIPPRILPPRRTLMWTRDPIAITPVGFIVSSMAKARRMEEPALMSAILKHHPDFGEKTIAVDLPSMQERDNQRYILEGGNIQIYDKIVAIGMGSPDADYANRTNDAGAEAATRELFQADKENKIEEIVHVYLPDLPINIHLDSVFNMVGPKSAVAMPYIFGYPEKPEKYIKPLMDHLRSEMLEAGADPCSLPKDTDYSKWGTAKVYTRESLSRADDFESGGREVNFFDYLVEQGQLDLDKVAWVGGEPDEFMGPIFHLMRAFQEQSSLGANVFTVAPFQTIAYHRNEYTYRSLDKVVSSQSRLGKVMLMSSNELRTMWGGPHCMAMPISRQPV